MRNLSEEVEVTYKKQFSRYIKLGVTPDSIEGMYTKALAAICTNPSTDTKIDKKITKKTWNAAKTGLEARKDKVAAAKLVEELMNGQRKIKTAQVATTELVK